MDSLLEKVEALIAKEAKENQGEYFDGILTREIILGERWRMVCQHNPARAVSSGAKVDAKSIAERPCFLCAKNRPATQSAVRFNDNFEILVNPFPCLKGHLTIPCLRHEAQAIRRYFSDMLDLAKTLDDFMVFYNGPKCGASAPDHLHFQAVRKGQTPMEDEVWEDDAWNDTEKGWSEAQGMGRMLLRVVANTKEKAVGGFEEVYDYLDKEYGGEPEPMFNLFVWYSVERCEWRIIFAPRKAHRPKCYDDGIMISPGALDMAGVLVLPKRDDYDTIDEKLIRQIMKECGR